MVAALVILAAVVGAPNAETLQQSRALFAQGQAAYKAGAFNDAIDAFLKADRLNPSPDLMYDVAQAYERLGSLHDAVEFYESYLSRAPRAPDAGAVRSLIASLKARLAEGATVAAPLVVVGAEPSAVPLAASPPEARRVEPKKPFHPTAEAIVFGVAGVVAAGFAIGGAVDVANFQGTRSKVQQQPPTISYTSANAQANAALGWGIAAIVLTIATAGCVTGAVLTW
jgi:tetratricopeptide (TPR) repeat protein